MKLRSLEDKGKIKIIKISLINFFMVDGGRKYDAIIQKDDVTYMIKLFGCLRKRYSIGFSKSTYTKYYYYALPLPIYRPEPIKITKKYKFNIDYVIELFKIKNWNTRDSNYYYGIYLISPAPLSARDEKNNAQLGNGDLVNGCYLYTTKAFFRKLG
ncbi:MAG: hypothetical protein GX321_00765 [Clostridiales bacterium]|nr:hypothetical protein [Clostridiales bacterium]